MHACMHADRQTDIRTDRQTDRHTYVYNKCAKEQSHVHFRSSIHRFFSASEENTLDWPSFSIKWPMTDVSPDLG